MRFLSITLLAIFSLVVLLSTSITCDDVDSENSASSENESVSPLTTTKPEEAQSSSKQITKKQKSKNFLNILNFFKQKSSNKTDIKTTKRSKGIFKHRLVTKSYDFTNPNSTDSNEEAGRCPFGCKHCKGGSCKLHKCKHSSKYEAYEIDHLKEESQYEKIFKRSLISMLKKKIFEETNNKNQLSKNYSGIELDNSNDNKTSLNDLVSTKIRNFLKISNSKNYELTDMNSTINNYGAEPNENSKEDKNLDSNEIQPGNKEFKPKADSFFAPNMIINKLRERFAPTNMKNAEINQGAKNPNQIEVGPDGNLNGNPMSDGNGMDPNGPPMGGGPGMDPNGPPMGGGPGMDPNGNPMGAGPGMDPNGPPMGGGPGAGGPGGPGSPNSGAGPSPGGGPGGPAGGGPSNGGPGGASGPVGPGGPTGGSSGSSGAGNGGPSGGALQPGSNLKPGAFNSNKYQPIIFSNFKKPNRFGKNQTNSKIDKKKNANKKNVQKQMMQKDKKKALSQQKKLKKQQANEIKQAKMRGKKQKQMMQKDKKRVQVQQKKLKNKINFQQKQNLKKHKMAKQMHINKKARIVNNQKLYRPNINKNRLGRKPMASSFYKPNPMTNRFRPHNFGRMRMPYRGRYG
ncbi:unnamed protein product [Brachionus calyciflorus]|uniref:Uncharacterized protein n=1 Tax=Brachionus calyciflorus TaxID=104777 RepID=A0A813T167_9BILA|nr:unnamed protein product [Brachionus calyciflorus]